MALGDEIDSGYKNGAGVDYEILNISCPLANIKYSIVSPSKFKGFSILGRDLAEGKLYRKEQDSVYKIIAPGMSLSLDIAGKDGTEVGFVSFDSPDQVLEAVFLK